jgi:transposase-like protein
MRSLTDRWSTNGRICDATYLKQRKGGRIVSVAAIIAVAANTDGRREIVGLHIGPSEAETFWSGFLKSLARRGLRGVKLVISDAHEGLKAAIRRVFGAAWQRCRVHWMRNALAYVPKTQQSMVAAALRQAFLQPDRAQASQMLRRRPIIHERRVSTQSCPRHRQRFWLIVAPYPPSRQLTTIQYTYVFLGPSRGPGVNCGARARTRYESGLTSPWM